MSINHDSGEEIKQSLNDDSNSLILLQEEETKQKFGRILPGTYADNNI